MRDAFLACAALAAASTAATPAAALPGRDDPGIAVAIADLDLSTPQGTAELNRRLARAAARVCRLVLPEALAIHARARCRNEAVESARGRAVAALAARSRSGEPRVAAATGR